MTNYQNMGELIFEFFDFAFVQDMQPLIRQLLVPAHASIQWKGESTGNSTQQMFLLWFNEACLIKQLLNAVPFNNTFMYVLWVRTSSQLIAKPERLSHTFTQVSFLLPRPPVAAGSITVCIHKGAGSDFHF